MEDIPDRFVVSKLVDVFESPLDTSVTWHYDLDHPLTREEVQAELDKGESAWVHPSYHKSKSSTTRTPEQRRCHAARIAWLIAHPDSEEMTRPISLDFGVDRLVEPIISDGNHRFAAAIFMGWESITATWGGNTRLAESCMCKTTQ